MEVGFFDTTLKRCTNCPVDKPICKKRKTISHWVKCTNNIKSVDQMNHNIKSKFSDEDLVEFTNLDARF